MDKIIVIVGPHTGDRTIAALCAQHTECYLIEPMPEAAKWLRDNNRDNQSVHIVEAACGERDGRAWLNVYNGGLSSSLGFCTDQARDVYPKADLEPKGTIEVKLINLNGFLLTKRVNRIETLITDAQGMDLTILKTMSRWLEHGKIKTVICEADCPGFIHYRGIPSNSAEDFFRFMSSYPRYEFQTTSMVKDRAQPDLRWERVDIE